MKRSAMAPLLVCILTILTLGWLWKHAETIFPNRHESFTLIATIAVCLAAGFGLYRISRQEVPRKSEEGGPKEFINIKAGLAVLGVAGTIALWIFYQAKHLFPPDRAKQLEFLGIWAVILTGLAFAFLVTFRQHFPKHQAPPKPQKPPDTKVPIVNPPKPPTPTPSNPADIPAQEPKKKRGRWF